VKYLKKTLEFNKLNPKYFVEPFVGGGSIFLNVLSNPSIEKVIIGDIDPLISSFWEVLFNEPYHLINFVRKAKLNLKNFDFYRDVATNEKLHSTRRLAEACLFLNRASFSGILAVNAGPIGGRKQTSKYKIGCRFNRKTIVQKIQQISAFSQKVTVLPFNWKKTLRYVRNKYKGEDVFVYLDPPFYNKAEKLYRYYFSNKKDHLALKKRLVALKYKWVLSYDRAPEIKNIYKTFVQKSFSFPYSINSPARRIEKEFFITSKTLLRPTKSFLEKCPKLNLPNDLSRKRQRLLLPPSLP